MRRLQRRRVPGAPPAQDYRDFDTGHPLGRRNNLANREATTIAKIVSAGRHSTLYGLQGNYVGVREVHDVNVIAYTSTVERIIVGT